MFGYLMESDNFRVKNTCTDFLNKIVNFLKKLVHRYMQRLKFKYFESFIKFVIFIDHNNLGAL